MAERKKREDPAAQVLGRTFFRLLCENPADSISVQRVCDEAGYHRTTFYKYYKDIFGLYIYLADVFSRKVVEIVDMALHGEPSCMEAIERLAREYKKPFHSIVNARYAKRLHYIMSMVLEKRLGQYISRSDRRAGGEIPAETRMRYCIGGFYQLSFVWIENVTKIGDRQYCRQMHDMLMSELGRLFLPETDARGRSARAERE